MTPKEKIRYLKNLYDQDLLDEGTFGALQEDIKKEEEQAKRLKSKLQKEEREQKEELMEIKMEIDRIKTFLQVS